jgi:hypothetical protein
MRVSALACVAALAATVAATAGPPPPGPEPTLAVVLARAAGYVAGFQARLSSIVAEETYVQERYAAGADRQLLDRRALRSDLVLMKPAGTGSWAEFRDVFEVDGRAIRPRDGRLERMLLDGAAASMHVATILAESARFNIGDVDRNVNTPVFSLRFLEADNQPRFRFKRTSGDGTNRAAPADRPSDHVFRVSTDVWVIHYDEVRSGTLIRTARRKDQPARGRFWIDPADGRVLVSELVLEDRTVRATIDVSFQSEPLLGMLVPVAMRERYVGKKTGSVVEGLATYGRFRRLAGGGISSESQAPLTIP